MFFFYISYLGHRNLWTHLDLFKVTRVDHHNQDRVPPSHRVTPGQRCGWTLQPGGTGSVESHRILRDPSFLAAGGLCGGVVCGFRHLGTKDAICGDLEDDAFLLGPRGRTGVGEELSGGSR